MCEDIVEDDVMIYLICENSSGISDCYLSCFKYFIVGLNASNDNFSCVIGYE